MSLRADTIKPNTGSRREKRRLGRGNGSGRGTTAGRGMKGQRARSGGKGGRKVLGFKQSFQKVPKLRGFTSPHSKAQVITLALLEKHAVEGQEVTRAWLKKVGVIRNVRLPVKVVLAGELNKKITLMGCSATKGALAAIEKVGGSVVF